MKLDPEPIKRIQDSQDRHVHHALQHFIPLPGSTFKVPAPANIRMFRFSPYPMLSQKHYGYILCILESPCGKIKFFKNLATYQLDETCRHSTTGKAKEARSFLLFLFFLCDSGDQFQYRSLFHSYCMQSFSWLLRSNLCHNSLSFGNSCNNRKSFLHGIIDWSCRFLFRLVRLLSWFVSFAIPCVLL